MQTIKKPTPVKQYPRARIIFRQGIWNAHIISHPIETPDKENMVGYAGRRHLAFTTIPPNSPTTPGHRRPTMTPTNGDWHAEYGCKLIIARAEVFKGWLDREDEAAAPPKPWTPVIVPTGDGA